LTCSREAEALRERVLRRRSELGARSRHLPEAARCAELAGGGVGRRAAGPARKVIVCICMVAGGGGGCRGGWLRMGLGGFCKAGGERESGVGSGGGTPADSGHQSYLARVSVPLQGKPRRPPARNLGPWKSGRKFIFFSPFPFYLPPVYVWRSFHHL